VFNYGRSYLMQKRAISFTMPGCIRNASPEEWGRRVLINRLTGRKPYWPCCSPEMTAWAGSPLVPMPQIIILLSRDDALTIVVHQ